MENQQMKEREKERERIEREREREKQEREQQERERQEKAVHKHFEESFRLANQKVSSSFFLTMCVHMAIFHIILYPTERKNHVVEHHQQSNSSRQSSYSPRRTRESRDGRETQKRRQ